MPPNTVSVARPGKWGNMYRIGDNLSYYLGPSAKSATAEQCVELYRNEWEAAFATVPEVAQQALEPLRGKNLACWCKVGDPCHADILLELANGADHD